MNKITVIQLLNKIANGEEVPKKLRYNFKTYFYDEACQDYTDYDRSYGLFSDFLENNYGLNNCLNDEVEIIEEEKKIPEKLKKKKTINGSFEGKTTYIYKYNEYEVGETINEIIDYLDCFKSKGE